MTEEEGHVTRDRGTRCASQEVFPGPIGAELTICTGKLKRNQEIFGIVQSNGFEMFEFLRKMSR